MRPPKTRRRCGYDRAGRDEVGEDEPVALHDRADFDIGGGRNIPALHLDRDTRVGVKAAPHVSSSTVPRFISTPCRTCGLELPTFGFEPEGRPPTT
jgi:hypothetical protein